MAIHVLYVYSIFLIDLIIYSKLKNLAAIPVKKRKKMY